MLLVIEGRTGARAAIAEAVALARAHGATLWLVASPEFNHPELAAVMTRQALRAARRAGVPAAMAEGLGSNEAAGLGRIAAQAACAVIVVGVAQASAVRRLLAGSLVPRLVTASPVHVLVVPDCEKGAPRNAPRRRAPDFVRANDQSD